MPFVVDASATLPWCFPDEATPSIEALLDQAASGEPIIVPAHWATEVSNALLMATRRKRIDQTRALRFLEQLAALHITFEPPLSLAQTKTVWMLCEQHKLTFYDGVYLELAARLSVPLATLDTALVQAARSASMRLI